MSGILDVFKGYGKIVRVEKKTTGAFYLIAIKYTDLKPKARKSTVKTKSSRNRIRKSLKRK